MNQPLAAIAVLFAHSKDPVVAAFDPFREARPPHHTVHVGAQIAHPANSRLLLGQLLRVPVGVDGFQGAEHSALDRPICGQDVGQLGYDHLHPVGQGGHGRGQIREVRLATVRHWSGTGLLWSRLPRECSATPGVRHSNDRIPRSRVAAISPQKSAKNSYSEPQDRAHLGVGASPLPVSQYAALLTAADIVPVEMRE
jgi:hypothetical protein